LNYLGGSYSGFNIFKYTLIIDTLPSTTDMDEDNEKTSHIISHYFGPRSSKPMKKNTSKKQKSNPNNGKKKKK